jgi:hypothetical protein
MYLKIIFYRILLMSFQLNSKKTRLEITDERLMSCLLKIARPLRDSYVLRCIEDKKLNEVSVEIVVN